LNEERSEFRVALEPAVKELGCSLLEMMAKKILAKLAGEAVGDVWVNNTLVHLSNQPLGCPLGDTSVQIVVSTHAYGMNKIPCFSTSENAAAAPLKNGADFPASGQTTALLESPS